MRNIYQIISGNYPYGSLRGGVFAFQGVSCSNLVTGLTCIKQLYEFHFNFSLNKC